MRTTIKGQRAELSSLILNMKEEKESRINRWRKEIGQPGNTKGNTALRGEVP